LQQGRAEWKHRSDAEKKSWELGRAWLDESSCVEVQTKIPSWREERKKVESGMELLKSHAELS